MTGSSWSFREAEKNPAVDASGGVRPNPAMNIQCDSFGNWPFSLGAGTVSAAGRLEWHIFTLVLCSGGVISDRFSSYCIRRWHHVKAVHDGAWARREAHV